MKPYLLWIWFCLFSVIASAAQPVYAQGPVETREFAWGLEAFTGESYTGVFSPLEKPSIYVLAGHTHVLISHLTMVYYWPIDREYKPDWSALNQPVDGTLVIRGPENQVTKIDPQYFLTKPKDGSPNQLDLLIGNAAAQAYNEYQQARDAYLASVSAYDTQLEAYMKAFALDPKTSMPVPTPPPTFGQAMAPPENGYPINLKAGTYQIYLANSSGQIISGSERTVISIEPRSESAGYTVIPENKWTQQEPSDSSTQVIYYSSGNPALYLQPFRTLEYHDQSFVRLEKPQDTTAPMNSWIWMHDTFLENVSLQVWAGGRLVDQVEVKPYSVQQFPGSALGYQIVPLDSNSSKAADFAAFRIAPMRGITHYSVRLVRMDGSVVPGSEREVIQTSDDLPLWTYGLIFIPLALRLGTGYRRRRFRNQSLKQLAAEESRQEK
jgi:hypothetical protein